MKLKDNKKMLWISKITLALSVFLLAFASFRVLLNIKRFKAESEGNTIADERSRRIGEKSGSFAFLLLIAVLIVSGLANSILNLRLEYTITVYVISVASMFSWIIIGNYIDKKG